MAPLNIHLARQFLKSFPFIPPRYRSCREKESHWPRNRGDVDESRRSIAIEKRFRKVAELTMVYGRYNYGLWLHMVTDEQ